MDEEIFFFNHRVFLHSPVCHQPRVLLVSAVSTLLHLFLRMVPASGCSYRHLSEGQLVFSGCKQSPGHPLGDGF